MAKSFLEKIGVIQSVEDSGSEATPKNPNADLFATNPSNMARPSATQTSEATAKVKTEIDPNIEHVDVVKEAYSSLPDSVNNIFVVEELLKNFAALPEEQRYTTVQATLKTMGLNVNNFITEANARKNAISNALQRTIDDVNANSERIAHEIADARKKIDELTAESLAINNGLDVSKKEAKKEYDRLNAIITVLGGNKTAEGGK